MRYLENATRGHLYCPQTINKRRWQPPSVHATLAAPRCVRTRCPRVAWFHGRRSVRPERYGPRRARRGVLPRAIQRSEGLSSRGAAHPVSRWSLVSRAGRWAFRWWRRPGSVWNRAANRTAMGPTRCLGGRWRPPHGPPCTHFFLWRACKGSGIRWGPDTLHGGPLTEQRSQ